MKKLNVYIPSSDYVFSFKILLFTFHWLWTMKMDSTNLHFDSWHKHYSIERNIYSCNSLELLSCSFTFFYSFSSEGLLEFASKVFGDNILLIKL